MEKNYLEVAQTLYPPEAERSYFIFSDYKPIIEYFGKVLVMVEDDECYSGDTRILYDDNGKGFGYLCIGWGSCSGCDRLQACENYKELAALIKDLEEDIKWLPRADMLKFFKEHDWKGDYSYSKDFVEKVISTLETPVSQNHLIPN